MKALYVFLCNDTYRESLCGHWYVWYQDIGKIFISQIIVAFCFILHLFSIAERIFCFEAIAYQTKSSQYPLHVL